MGNKRIIHVGTKFGRLEIIEEKPSRRDKSGKMIRYFLCLCECGKEKVIRIRSLLSGDTTSCGCRKIEMTIRRSKKHGMIFSREYAIWHAMKQRCLNGNCESFKDYGGRGITVSKEWLQYENFYRDMGLRPEGTTLDRIDNNKGYCKENCRWATRKEQARNTRSNRLFTYNGETKCIAQWADDFNINTRTLIARLNYGFSIQEALNFKKNGRRM